jgi:S-methylmethionine-dependent homocysteine/selenocysteine methylase
MKDHDDRTRTLTELIASGAPVLVEGGRSETLRRAFPALLDPHVGETALVFHDEGREVLAGLIRSHLDVGRDYGFPMLLGTPSFRAGPERLERAGLEGLAAVNAACVRFAQEIRSDYGPYANQIFIGGYMSCRGDAYRPREGLSEEAAETWHRPQAEALASAGVDFLWAVTLPAAPESLGLARAMAATGLPYGMGYLVRPTGTLLDSTALHRVVKRIDDRVIPGPLFSIVNCVHPAVAEQALEKERKADPGLTGRLIGIMANASSLPPEELDKLPYMDGEDPGSLAEQLVRLHRRFGFTILGGCCGTDPRLLACTARLLEA